MYPIFYNEDSPISLDLKPEQWTQDGYAKTDICDRLLKDCPDEIERINCEDYTPEQFIEKFESQNKPCVIRGLAKDWKIDKYWTYEVKDF